ncbi:hypothetical protein [Spiroplasma endosymbiont of Virgichneumon dumeticola]|uniref:hypothetical protein n=1 Tax=Spiroplasma endosymbiont of Virgichneumon dumeticola TaxID=3139323 RepID=UPI0035C9310A
MENKNNWNVNLNYIIKDDLKTIYGFIPDADQTTTDTNKTDLTVMAIAISSERINTITGNQIELTEFKNLNETQKQLVKRATARLTIHYLTDGMGFFRSSVYISGNGLSSSISPPSEPDYVLMEVYNLLQQANLHTPRKAISSNISCNKDNFNTPSIFDESDTRVITWDSGNKTFLRKQGIIAGTGITIQDVSDTIPKLKINSTGGGNLPEFKSPKETIDITYDKETHIVNSDVSDKIEERIFTNKYNRDISQILNDITNQNVLWKHIDYRYVSEVDKPHWAFNFEQYTTATLLPKKYADDKLQNKLIAGTNITIDKDNKISATGGKTDLTDYYKKEETNELLDKKQDKTDNALITTDKTITGAINEVKNVNDTQDLHISQIKTEVTNVQGVLVLKQDKLTAGTNITIKDNVISATGGSSVDENRIFNNKNDKDNTTRLVNDIIKTNVGGKTLIYRNNPVITDDLDIPNKKYVDERIKSLNVIKWKNIGIKESNIKINYDFKVNTLYRVGYCWKNVEKSPIIYMQFLWQGEGAVLASFFKGISGKRITESYVDLVVISNAIAMDRFNDDEGKIYSLEEELKENTYKITSNTLDITSPSIINIDKPIKINSKSLETNEIEDNCWDIELKDNPTPNPNPNPSIPKWKEVGTRITKNQINYKFFSGKKYRVTYIWDGDTQPIAYSISKEFNKLWLFSLYVLFLNFIT